MTDLTIAERAVVEAIREHIAHGFGEIHIIITDDKIDIQEGKRTRFRQNAATSRHEKSS